MMKAYPKLIARDRGGPFDRSGGDRFLASSLVMVCDLRERA